MNFIKSFFDDTPPPPKPAYEKEKVSGGGSNSGNSNSGNSNSNNNNSNSNNNSSYSYNSSNNNSNSNSNSNNNNSNNNSKKQSFNSSTNNISTSSNNQETLFNGLHISNPPPPESFDMFSGLSLSNEPITSTIGTSLEGKELNSSFNFISEGTREELSGFGFVLESKENSSLFNFVDERVRSDSAQSTSNFGFLSSDNNINDDNNNSMFADLNVKTEVSMFGDLNITNNNNEVSMFSDLNVSNMNDESNNDTQISMFSELNTNTNDSNLSINEQFYNTKNNFDTLLKNYWQNKINFSLKKRECEKQIEDLNILISEDILKCESIEREQALAIEHELFEKADILNSQLIELNNTISLNRNEKNKLEHFIQEQSFQQNNVDTFGFKQIHDNCINWKSRQEIIKNEFEESEVKVVQQLESVWENFQSGFDVQEQAYLEMFEQHNNKQKTIDESIEQSCRPVEARRSLLELRQFEIDAEIDTIEKRLIVLRSEKKQCIEEAIEIDTEMKSIRAGFELPLNELLIAKESLNEVKKTVDAERIKALAKREAYINEKDKYESKSSEMEALLVEISKQSENVLFMESFIEAEKNAFVKLIEASNLQAELTLQSSDHILRYDDDLESINSEKSRTVSDIESLGNEVSSISAKIPLFEVEKKTAIAAKNFKDAGRITNDIKAISTRLSECNTLIEDNKSKLIEIESRKASAIADRDYFISSIKSSRQENDLKFVLAYSYYSKFLNAYNFNQAFLDTDTKAVLFNLRSITNEDLANMTEVFMKRYDISDVTPYLIDLSAEYDRKEDDNSEIPVDSNATFSFIEATIENQEEVVQSSFSFVQDVIPIETAPQIIDLESELSSGKERLLLITASIEALNSEILFLNESLENSIASEDFENADIIQSSIDQKSNSLNNLNIEHSNLDKRMNELESSSVLHENEIIKAPEEIERAEAREEEQSLLVKSQEKDVEIDTSSEKSKNKKKSKGKK